MKPLAPGESRLVSLGVLLCRCARCGHGSKPGRRWVVMPKTEGADLVPPKKCPQCDAKTWAQRVPRKAGRPPKEVV